MQLSSVSNLGASRGCKSNAGDGRARYCAQDYEIALGIVLFMERKLELLKVFFCYQLRCAAQYNKGIKTMIDC